MFSKKRRLDIVTDYDYDQYTKTNLQPENKELYFVNKQLYDKNKQLLSENEWLKETCRRFERTVIQLSEQLYSDNMQKEKLQAENEQLDVEKKKLIKKMNTLKLRLEKIEDKFKKQLDSDKLVHELISEKTHLQNCLADRNKEIKRQIVFVEERNKEIKSQKAIMDFAERVSEAKDIIVEELQEQIKALETRIQIIIDENDDTVKGLENNIYN